MDNKEEIARELVASSSIARYRQSNIPFLIAFIILNIFALITFCPKSYASVPTMSTEQAQYIIDYFLNSGDYTHAVKSSATTTNTQAQTILQNINAQTLAQNFNTLIQGYNSGDLSWENITVFLLKDAPERSWTTVTFYFTISNNTVGNDLGFLQLIQSNNTSIGIINSVDYNAYFFWISVTSAYNYRTQNLTKFANTSYIPFSPKISIIFNESNSVLTSMPFALSIGTPATIYYNNVGYLLGNNSVHFNNDGTIGIITPTPTLEPTPTETPSGDSGQMIDYTNQLNNINNNITNSTNTIIEQISGDTQKIINSIDNISADYSGDIKDQLPTQQEFLEETGFKTYQSPYSTWVTTIVESIYEALVGVGNVNLQINYRDFHYNLSSNEFIVPNNPLKIWANSSLIAIIIWNIMKFAKQITDGLTEGNINVLHMADADMYFF